MRPHCIQSKRIAVTIYITYLKTKKPYSHDDMICKLPSELWNGDEVVVQQKHQKNEDTKQVTPNVEGLIAPHKQTGTESIRI
jgi:hypothetical protein